MRLQAQFFLVVALIVSMPESIVRAEEGRALCSITISGPQTVHIGEAIVVHIVFKNISDHDIPYHQLPGSGLAEAFYNIYVHDNVGSGPPLTQYGRDARRHLFVGSEVIKLIGPGQSVTQETNLSKQFDLSEPGVYHVQLSLPLPENPGHVVVESNEITITVLPKKPKKAI